MFKGGVRGSEMSMLKKILHRLSGVKTELRVGIKQGATNTEGEDVAQYARMNEYGGTIDHPGGQPFFKDKEGNIVYVSKKSPRAKKMKKTKPHKIIIPPRPFMRQTYDKHSKKWEKIIARRAKATPEDIKAAFELAGEVAWKDMVNVLENTGTFQENAPSTIAKKGRNKPLYGKGDLVKSITYQVKE